MTLNVKTLIGALSTTALLSAVSLSASAALELQALSSFGGGDGWLAPGESGFNAATGATVRGITYNAATNRVYVVDREGGTAVKILDGDTGLQVGTLDLTGVAGGTFVLSQIDVADDGAIYASNLSTSATSNFKVYRWANEAAAPTVAFDGPAGRIRTGDSMAVIGSGVNTRIAAAGGSTAGQDYALLSTVDGLTFTVSNPVAVGAATGAFRLGIDFDGAGNLLGSQTGLAGLTSAPELGGAAAAFARTSAGEAPMAFDPVDQLLATVDINNNAVRLYDGSDLSLLSTTGLLDTENLSTSFVSNGNGVGDLKFGRTVTGELRLYALNANNGIQAFVVVPEPATAALLGLGGLAMLRRRGA